MPPDSGAKADTFDGPLRADFVAEVADEGRELAPGVEPSLGCRSLRWLKPMLAPSTRPRTPPDALCPTWAGQRRRSRDELGQPAEVLRGGCQRELELGTARPAQSQAAEP
jgi:hypothetical protein